MIGPRHEQGAALVAVLAMVALLAGLATLGLGQLRAAAETVGEAEELARAQALLHSAGAVAVDRIAVARARGERQPAFLGRPMRFAAEDMEVTALVRDGGACFNLNALASDDPVQRPHAPPETLARLLTAAGLAPLEAGRIARATAGRLQQLGLPWADPSEWAGVEGVTVEHWRLASPVLCALPSREPSSFSVNALGPQSVPLLVAAGLSPEAARRLLVRRPADGWASIDEFWASGGSDRPAGLAARLIAVESRWLDVTLAAESGTRIWRRRLLVDSRARPPRIVRSEWLPPSERPVPAS